jgi:nonsense-mediated mRNA decay protein 3
MLKKFCPNCGNPTEKFYNNLCGDCFLKNVSILETLPKRFVVMLCKICGKYYLGSESGENLDEVVEKMLKKMLKKPESKFATYRLHDKKVFVTLQIKIQDLQKTEEKEFDLVLKGITCNFCNLKKSGYYKAILQLRVRKDIEKIVQNEIDMLVAKLNKSDNFAFISQRQKLKEGIDLYFGSKSAASKVAQYLKKKYGAEIKISQKIFGMTSSGKTAYRDTILVSIK